MSFDKYKGGVGLHNISKRNMTIRGKLIWEMYTKFDSKWCKIMQAKYLDAQNSIRIFTISNPLDGSAM